MRSLATKRKLNKQTNTITKEEYRKRIRLNEYKLPVKGKMSHQGNDAEVNNNAYAITEILEPKMQANANKYTLNDKNKENKNNNNQQKNISWRSPLVSSPAIKFSPKIAYQKMSPRESFRFESPAGRPSNIAKPANVPTLILNFVKTPKSKQKPDYGPFPLRDKDYEKEDKPEKKPEDDMDYPDIYSSPTLDRIRSAKKYKQCSPNSAMEYFSQFEQGSTADKQAEVSQADTTQNDSVKEDLERTKDSFKTFEFEERSSTPESALTQRMRNDFGSQNRQYTNNLTIPSSQKSIDSVAVYTGNPTRYIQGPQKFYQPAQHTITSQMSASCSGCMNPQCSGSIYRRPEYQVSQQMNVSQSLPLQVTNPHIQYIPRPALPSFYNYRTEAAPQLRVSTPNHPTFYPHHSHYFPREPEQFPNEMLNEIFAHDPSGLKMSCMRKEQIKYYADFGYPQRMNTQELGDSQSERQPRSFCDEEQKSYDEEPLDNSMSLKPNLNVIPTPNNDFVEERSLYMPKSEMYNPSFSAQGQAIANTPMRASRSSDDLGFPRSVSQCFEDRHMAVDHRFVQSGHQAPVMPVMIPHYPPFYNQNIVCPRYVSEAYAYTRGIMEQPIIEYQSYMSPRRYGQPLPSQAGNDKEYVMNKFLHSLEPHY